MKKDNKTINNYYSQNIKSNKFRPYDEVTRAEFATALSRMLY